MAPRTRAALLAALALPATSPAQTPEGSMPAAPSEGTPPSQAPAAPGEISPEGTYTIRTGDTLWDLSQRFLNNPWYWPKIWADNPAIENPHWIYPGNGLKIRQGAEGLPGEVAPAQQEEEDSWADEGEPLPKVEKSEVADFSVGSTRGGDALGQDPDLVSIAGSRGIGLPPGGVLRARVESIVTTGELAQSGSIEASFEQKGMLSVGDKVYVKFKDLDKVRAGEQYSVFKTGEEIIHPLTRQSYGFQTLLLGSMRIITKESGNAVAEMTAAYDAIERGNRVGPAAALDKVVRPTPNGKKVDGVILATHLPKQYSIGEQSIVFIDRGSEQGVAEGNTFTVVQHGDGLEMLQMDPSLGVALVEHREGPGEPVASLVVFDVRPNTSAAVVTRSVREVNVGDKCVMRPAGGGAGGDVGP